MCFENYLNGLKYSPKTIARYLAWKKEFSTFFSKENNHKLLNYNDLLSYFIEKESRGLTRSTLVHLLARIKCYYSYLEVENH
jgi:site-specific recombinase XerD